MLVGLLIIAYLSYYSPITDPYYPLNAGWDGCSQIYAMAQRGYILNSYSNPLAPVPSLVAIIGPRIPFDKSESARLTYFLEAGGTVLLADDYGAGNTLLENLNVSVRFTGEPLADLYFYSKSPSFPIISHFALDPITRNLTTMIFDHPTYLSILNPSSVTVLALSSPFSFVDLFNNGTLPPTEKTQSYPMIASVPIGKGLLVLVADSYAFTNEMIGILDNRVLFGNLLGTANGTASFDVVHLKKAALTDYRIAFRNELDSWVAVLHSIFAQLALTATLVVVFSALFIRERIVERRHASYSSTESSLHMNEK